MRLRVNILDSDEEYLQRLAKVIHHKYQERIELCVFSDRNKFLEDVRKNCPEVILLDEGMELGNSIIFENIACGYLTRVRDVQEIRNIPTIFKYQNANNLFQKMTELYVVKQKQNLCTNRRKSKTKVIAFTSAQGGCGTTSAAVAYAVWSAQNNKKVLYLNFDCFGNSTFFIKQEENDSLYRIQTEQHRIDKSLKCAIHKDESGFSFLDVDYACQLLQCNDWEIVINSIFETDNYDEIIFDFSGNTTEKISKIKKVRADRIVYVTDGSDTGKDKFVRFFEAVKRDQKNEYDFVMKAALLYNCFRLDISKQFENIPVPVLGGISQLSESSGRKTVERMSQIDLWNNI